MNRQSSSRPVGTSKSAQLERAVPLAPAVAGHRCRAVRVRLAAEPAGLRGEDLGRAVNRRPLHLQLDEPVELEGVLHRELLGDPLDEAPPHLHSLDEAVELEGVLHRELLGDRLDEAAHDHRHRLVLGQPAAHQVEELVVADLGDGRLVAHGHVVLADVDVGVGVAAADRVDEQRVALHRRPRAVGALLHLHETAVRRAAAAARHRLGDDRRGRVRRGVHHLGAGVLVLALAGEGDRQRLALGVLAEQVAGGVLHGDLGADVAVDPLHPAAGLHRGALGDQVVDVVRPVLDGRVADVGVLLHDDLDDRGVQRVGRVDRRGAALDVVHLGALVGDDQRPLELAHVLGVDPEVGLQRDVDLHARRHVDERAARPDRGVERGELVVADRDDRAEVLPEQVLVLAQRGVGVEEEDALLLQVLADLVVDDLGLVLRGDAGDQPLLLGLRDAEPVVGVLDVGRQLVPGGRPASRWSGRST